MAQYDGTIKIDTSVDEAGLVNGITKLKKIGGAAAKAVGAAAAATGAAMVAFGKQSIEAGMQFDSSMSQVAATMGTTVDQIGELRDFAMEMGSKTAFSATQAADALNYMALAGYDAETSMSMLPNVLNLAAAGGMELASASDMITDSQSALGLTLDETSQLVDKMAKASSKSNTSVAQLGEAILTVGGTAKNMAGGTTELTTALGILADNGTKGAEGGTKLRNILLSLGAPTDKAAKLLDSLKVSAYDADGHMRPLKDTFADLNKAMEGMTDAQKTDIINTVFNKADLKDVNALLATSSERWDELSAAIDESAGAAQAMADTQLDNLAGDVTLFQSALEGAQIALSDALTPALREFVQFGSQGLSELTEAFKSGDFGAVVDTFQNILTDGLNRLIEALPKFIDVGTDILLALVNGIISALPTLGAAAFEIINNLASSIGDALPALIPAAVEAIVGFVMALTDPNNLSSLIDGALSLIMGLADGLIAALPILIENTPIIIQNLVDAIVSNAPKLLDAALELVLTLAEGIITNLPALLQAVVQIGVSIITGLWDLRNELLSWLGELIANIFNALVEFGANALNWVVTAIPELIASAVTFFSELPGKIWDFLVEAIVKIAEWGMQMREKAISAAREFLTNLVNGIKELPGKIWTFLVETVTKVAAWGMQMRQKAITAAREFLTNLVNGIKALPGKIWSFLVSTVSKIANFVTEMKTKATDAAKGFITNIVNGLKSLPGKMLSIGTNVVKGIWNGIKDATKWILDKIKGFGKSVLNGIKSIFGIASPSKVTKGYGKFFAEGFGIGFEKELPDVRRKLFGGLEDMSRKMRGMVNVENRLMAAGAYGGQGYSSVTNNTSTTYNPTLNFYREVETPSQAARAWRKAMEVIY